MPTCAHCGAELLLPAAFCPSCAQPPGRSSPRPVHAAPKAPSRELHPLLGRTFHDSSPAVGSFEPLARRFHDSSPPPAAELGRELSLDRRGPSSERAIEGEPIEPARVAPSTAPAGRRLGASGPPEFTATSGGREVRIAPVWRRIEAWGADALAILVVAWLFLGLAALLVHHGPSSRETGLDYLAETALAYRRLWLPGSLLVALLSVIYLGLFTALGGPTPGKRLAGLTVVDRAGRCPSPARSAARSLAAVGSVPLGLLGFSWVLLDRRRQALHDKLTGTFVILASAEPSPATQASHPGR